jgi:hypothetical protein
MKKINLLSILFCLSLVSFAYSQSAVKWKPEIEMDNQIFPSYLLATATKAIDEKSDDPYYIGDIDGKLGVSITNPTKNSKLKLSIKVDQIVDLQEFEVILPEVGKEYEIFPSIVWNWDVLRKMQQSIPANATFTMTLNGKPIGQKNVVVRIRSINEAVTAYKYRESEEWEETPWMFAAYVNEDHSWIDPLLKEALNTEIVEQFDGFLSGDDEQVYRQVFAIWNILQKRGFKYSSITNSSGVSEKVHSQYVRFFEDSIKTSQANCVDGSVLLVSILRKIGIRADLVLIPGHCFILIYTNGSEEPDVFGLETTMMGSVNLGKFADEGSLSNLFGQTTKNQASWKTFVAAINSGNKTYNDNYEKISSEDQKYIQYQLIDIEQARKDKILPIAR